MTTVRQPTKHRRSCVLTLKYIFICVYWWTRQRIHNTLIAVDRYLRLMGDKTIPDSAEPRLDLFYPPFVAGIDLPHQGVVDSYNLHMAISMLKIRRPLGHLIFNRGIAIPGKTVFLIETAPRRSTVFLGKLFIYIAISVTDSNLHLVNLNHTMLIFYTCTLYHIVVLSKFCPILQIELYE